MSIDLSSSVVLTHAASFAACVPARRACCHASTGSKTCANGFSLVELLVVVVIIGVIALVVTLSIASGAQRQLLHEAERFQALAGQACAQAELSGREIGIVIDPAGYSFRLLGGTEWQDFPDGSEFRARRWLDGMQAELTREGRDVDLSSGRAGSPQLVCFSSGELTPFALVLALGDAPHYRVSGTEDATLKTERVGTVP